MAWLTVRFIRRNRISINSENNQKPLRERSVALDFFPPLEVQKAFPVAKRLGSDFTAHEVTE